MSLYDTFTCLFLYTVMRASLFHFLHIPTLKPCFLLLDYCLSSLRFKGHFSIFLAEKTDNITLLLCNSRKTLTVILPTVVPNPLHPCQTYSLSHAPSVENTTPMRQIILIFNAHRQGYYKINNPFSRALHAKPLSLMPLSVKGFPLSLSRGVSG